MGLAATNAVGHGLRHLDAAAHGDEVHVVARAMHDDVAHITAHHIALAMQRVGDVAHEPKHRLVDVR